MLTKLVAVANEVLNRVIVPEAEVKSEIVVVARFDLPVTTKVLVVVALVVVELVTFRLVIYEVRAERIVE